MGHTTIRVDEETKRHVDRIHRNLQADLGRRLTLDETISRMAWLADRRSDLLVSDAAEPWQPPSKEWVERFLRDLPDPGVDTDASKVDEYLYGKEST